MTKDRDYRASASIPQDLALKLPQLPYGAQSQLIRAILAVAIARYGTGASIADLLEWADGRTSITIEPPII